MKNDVKYNDDDNTTDNNTNDNTNNTNDNNKNINIGEDLWRSYQDKRNNAKRMIKERISQQRVQKSINIANKGGTSCKDFWKSLRGQNSKKNSKETKCIKIPGSEEIATDKDRISLTVKEYWETLGSNSMDVNDCNGYLTNNFVKEIRDELSKEHPCLDDIEQNFLYDIVLDIDIVEEAVNLSKNNKAPGLDTITNELLKNGGHCILITLLNLFEKCIELEKLPQEWNKGVIIPIFKKGDRKDLNNYRGITLTSCVSKIFNRIISINISNYLENMDVLSEVQGGFRTSHRCEDHIFTLKGVASCRLKENKTTHIAFLDFRKAFDSIWRDGLLKSVWLSGIRGKVWRLVDKLYKDVTGTVKFGEIDTEFFEINQGVKQGCVLSPVLFNIFINEFKKILVSHDLGVRIKDNWLGGLFWADDIVLLANNEFEMNKMLSLATQFAKEWKLNFNFDKSNILVVGKRINKEKQWKLGDSYITEVDSYKYLGVLISRNLNDHMQFENVIKKGNRLIAYIKSVIDSFDNFSRVYYGDILWRTIALPSINYGSDVWCSVSKSDIDKLEKIQLQMARYILKAPMYTPRSALYGELGWIPIRTMHDISRIKYFDRLLRLKSYRWPKLLLTAQKQIICDPNEIRFKFLKCIFDVFTKCESEDLLEYLLNNRENTYIYWLNPLLNKVKDINIKNWREDLENKTSLTDYALFKDTIGLEKYLLDKLDFEGVSLKFKLRSNTLPLDSRVSRWSNENNGLCTLCDNNHEEDIRHFLFTCPALQNIRSEELDKLQHALQNFNDVWDQFTIANIDTKLQYVLWSTSLYLTKEIESLFDKFCKSYGIRAWRKRSEIKHVQSLQLV